MGPMTRIKYNKLIAKFMDVETCTDTHDDGPCYYVPIGMSGKFEYGKDYSLKYDESYEWLMPVVNKCINIYHDRRSDIFQALMSGKGIKPLFKAVAEFVEWYEDPNGEWIVANGYPVPEHKKTTSQNSV
jgi:hypothetical protein